MTFKQPLGTVMSLLLSQGATRTRTPFRPVPTPPRFHTSVAKSAHLRDGDCPHFRATALNGHDFQATARNGHVPSALAGCHAHADPFPPCPDTTEISHFRGEVGTSP